MQAPRSNKGSVKKTRKHPSVEIDPKMLELLVCPQTKATLHFDKDAQELISQKAGLAYPVRDGVPILLASEARVLDD